MKKMKVMLGSIEDVKEFVALTNSYSVESDLVSGRYAVDAKSIMGIFSLDLAKPLEFVVHSETKEADELLDAVTKFRAE
ncbi:pTS HPr component phosphorylation site [Eubacterium sp. CAG:786]|nr:pTS HPr component phosphorylation site [Eubacterium sp. CAG:786]